MSNAKSNADPENAGEARDDAAAAASEPSEVRRLGRYSLLQRLSVGGHAELFVARDEDLVTPNAMRRLCVVKVFLPAISNDGAFIDGLIREERRVAALSHPHIARIRDMGQIDETWILARDYISGVDLAVFVRRAVKLGETIPEELVCHIIAAAADGLANAHSAGGIVHRDITPHTVMLSFDGEVKLIDFGGGRARDVLLTTQTGRVKDKFCYVAPEQAEGGAPDHRANVFSLGIVMWELLARRRLFKGEDAQSVMKLLTAEPLPDLAEFAPDVSPELREIVEKALARDPAERFTGAAQFAGALRSHIAQQEWEGSAKTLASHIQVRFRKEYETEQRAVDKWISEDEGAAAAAEAQSKAQPIPSSSYSRPLSGAASSHYSMAGVSSPSLRPGSSEISRPSGSVSAPHSGYGSGVGSGVAYPPGAPLGAPPPRSNAGVWALIVVLIAALGAGAAWYLTRKPAGTGTSEGALQLNVTPPDGRARIFLDGEKIPGHPPLKIAPIPAGVHTLRVEPSDELMAPFEQEISISEGVLSDMDVRLEKRRVALTLIVNPGGAKVELSQESGAKVSTRIDKGVEEGEGHRGEELEAGGTYDITVTKQGFYTWEGAITLGPVDEQEFSVFLEEGSDEPEVPPDSDTGEAPVVKPKPKRKKVVARARARAKPEPPPEPPPEDDGTPVDSAALTSVRGYLNVTTNPSGLKFRVEGLSGSYETPYDQLKVGTGPRKVIITGPDGKEHSKLVVVFGDKTTPVKMDLSQAAATSPRIAAQKANTKALLNKLKGLKTKPSGADGSGGDEAGDESMPKVKVTANGKVAPKSKAPKKGPKATASSASAAPKAAKAGMGFLMVVSKPKAQLFVDDKPTGLTTPVRRFDVPVGRHKVTLLEPKSGQKKERWVVVRENQASPVLEKF